MEQIGSGLVIQHYIGKEPRNTTAIWCRTPTFTRTVGIEGLNCASELFLIATLLTKDAWPRMSWRVPNSISCSQFANHIRERAHRRC